MVEALNRVGTPPLERIVLLAHGWAYDPSFFLPWLAQVQTSHADWLQSSLVLCMHRGYFTGPDTSPWVLYAQQNWQNTHHTPEKLMHTHAHLPWLGMGHSLGFSHVLNQTTRWQSLVSLHGFTQFVRNTTNSQGIPDKVILRMLRKLDTNPLALLQEFQTQCGLTMPPSAWAAINDKPINTPHSLWEDLHCLLRLNTKPLPTRAVEQGTRVLAIGSANDAIVPLPLTLACFEQVSLVECPHAGFAQEPARYTSLTMAHLQSSPNAPATHPTF